MACSSLFRIFLKSLSKFFPFSNLSTRKIFDYKEIFFLFYVAKSISFEVISVLKIKHFCGRIDNFMTSIEILKLNRNNYYLATEIERKPKYISLF